MSLTEDVVTEPYLRGAYAPVRDEVDLVDEPMRPSALSVAPAPLAGFEEAESTEEGPVVVLDKLRPKDEPPEDDYLAELGRRLDLEKDG